MEANASQRAALVEDVTPAALAGQLLQLWKTVLKDSSGEFVGLLEELDLSITQVKALDAVGGCPSELSVKELSERLGISLPSASRTVEALLQRGWLERREDERDRRVKRIRATDAGRDVVARINGVRLKGLEHFAESLDPDRRALLSSALVAVTEDETPTTGGS
jgi:DNA-binding MarR family transcriptional regulator